MKNEIAVSVLRQGDRFKFRGLDYKAGLITFHPQDNGKDYFEVTTIDGPLFLNYNDYVEVL